MCVFLYVYVYVCIIMCIIIILLCVCVFAVLRAEQSTYLAAQRAEQNARMTPRGKGLAPTTPTPSRR